MVKCPECDVALDIDVEDVAEGDEFSCDECGADLRVVGTEPLEVDSVEDLEEEEDDDEGLLDDEEDEEEEDEDWK